MFRNNQNDLNFSPQQVGLHDGGYGSGAPVIAPTFVSGAGSPYGYGYTPPVAPIAPLAPVYGGGCNNGWNNNNWLELLIAAQLFGRDGFGRGGHGHGGFPFPFPNPCKDDNDGNLAILAAVAGSKDATIGEGRAILAGLANNKDITIAEARALFNAICDSEKTNLQQFNALAIQNSNNTQSIKDQATSQHAAILAAINNSDLQRLRDELFNERRGRDRSDLEIQIQNTNTNTNAQFQAQAQAQLQRDFDEHRRRFDNREIEINNINTNTAVATQLQQQQQQQAIRDRDLYHDFGRKFDELRNQVNQVAKNQNDVINFGTMAASGNQTSSATNVNSKNNQ